jgi:hypothetical protein
MKSNQYQTLFMVLVVGLVLFLPEYGYGSFESSLISLKTKVTGVILPLISVIGLAIAAMSFYTGNPQAKQHIIYAIVGCIFGFGAQAIVDFIAQTVR